MKILLSLSILAISVLSFSQTEPPTIMPGIGPTYSFGLNAPGINVRTYFAANHHFCFGPEVSFFQKVQHEEEEISLFEANVNLHYLFEVAHHVALYPLGGINYTIEGVTDLHTNERHDENAWGANIGGGVHFAYGRFLFFGEYKYVVSHLDDHFATVGALYNISLKKKKGTSVEHH